MHERLLTWRGHVHPAKAVAPALARLPLLALGLPGEVSWKLMIQQLQVRALRVLSIVLEPRQQHCALIRCPFQQVGKLCLLIISVADGLLILQVDCHTLDWGVGELHGQKEDPPGTLRGGQVPAGWRQVRRLKWQMIFHVKLQACHH